MVEVNTGVEQGVVVGQYSQADFEATYKTEVAMLKTGQITAYQRTWETIEKRAAETEPWYRQEAYEGYKPRQISVTDRLRRQTLSLQARVEGVRDINQFQQLVDYFESTITMRESVYLKLPKGLSDERKKQEEEKWTAKGYTSNHYFNEYDDHTSFSPQRQVPLRLKREQVKVIKGLMSSVNNPVEIVDGLRKIGFRFNEYTFSDEDKIAKLAQLFLAPHAKEAISIAQRIKYWYDEWFASTGGYGQRVVEVGQLDFLIQLAQSPDPKSILPDDFVQKINVISGAIKHRVGVPEIEQFKTIADNPDYLELAAVISQNEHHYYRDSNPTFDNMQALDQAGLLKPLLALRHSGIALGDDSLKTLFDSYEAKDKPYEIRQQVIGRLRYQLADTLIQSFLQDSTKQEFVGVITNITGHPIRVEELESLDNLFGAGLIKRNEAVYLIKLLHGSGEVKNKTDLLSLISNIIHNSSTLQAFADHEFPRFLEDLRTKAGYTSNYYDTFSSYRKIADVFNNPELRQGLTQNSTLEIIRALHPQGVNFDSYNIEYYIGLAQNPNALRTINLLKDLGCQFGSYNNNPSKETFEAIANYPESLTKLALPEVKDLATKLRNELRWEVVSYDVVQLLKMYDDKNLQQQLFSSDNLEFIKKMRPNGFSLSEVHSLLAIDQPARRLLVELADKYDYLPQLGWGANRALLDQNTLSRLLTNTHLREGLFSEKTQQLVGELKKIGLLGFNLKYTDLLVSLPSDFPQFVVELKNKYFYLFREHDLELLKELQGNRENLYKLLDGLIGSGYALDLKDLDKLSLLVGHADKMPTLLSSLKEVVGYQFDPNDTQLLKTLAIGNFSKERLTSLKEIYRRYKNPWAGEFGLQWIQKVSVIENSEGVIKQLAEITGHEFTLNDTESLRFLVNEPDKAKVFAVLGILQSKFGMQFQMNNMYLYVSVANIPEVGRKLDEADMALPQGEFNDTNNLRLFAGLRGEAGLYNHARKLLSDDYFIGIRDAKNRIGQFMSSVYRGEISDDAVARVFTISTKATELDRLTLKLGINAEIARYANRKDWYASLLQANNFQEANEGLTRLMTELALPIVYADLQGEEFTQKQNTLVELASQNREFGDILEICCRSVGIYGKIYPNRGVQFTALMGAIRQSIDLNLERNPKAYLQMRAELSAHQFDRIFEGFPQNVRDMVLQTWLDLSPKRRLRVSGTVITAEEATLSRLNRIKDIVQTDLSVHLQTLFMAKIGELEMAAGQSETNGRPEQLAIYRQYLLTPKGAIRQDIPRMYRSIETFVRSGKQALKSPDTPKEEKSRLGRSLGNYQAISDSLKALYRLGTISEERYKTRRDYLNELDKDIIEFTGALKRLRLLDPERRSADVNMRAFEEEVLLDLGKLKGTMSEENVAGQTIFETESTIAFRDLARAPDLTQSCQRLTEVTGYNQAAYSRLIDGNDEMIDVYELRSGEKNRLARSFIELSRIIIAGEQQPRLAVLIDREYVNPQYQHFESQFSTEMLVHVLDRFIGAPEVLLLFDSYRIGHTEQIAELLR